MSEDFGYGPYFINEMRRRMNQQLAVNVVITGEAGISKSYTAKSLCRMLNPRFCVDDIVISYAEYMEALLKKNREGVPIMFDEPQYALDKRDWFNQVNKALVKTITSQRFRLRPLFIPIVNLSMLDKVLRSYLIQFHVIMQSRGIGTVYRLQPSQMEDKLYRSRICKLEYGLFDKNQCEKPSCLKCDNLETCEVFRAQYERKKATWLKGHDETQLDEAIAKENKITDDDLIAILYDNRELLKKGTAVVDGYRIIVVLKDKAKIKIGKGRAYDLRSQLLYKYPDINSEKLSP